MTALIAGATGLVGSAIARELAGRLGFRATALVRRPAPALPAAIEQIVCDFARLDDLAPVPGVSTVFCALGTTIAKAGSKDAFRAVDYDAVLALGRFGKRSGARRFLLVSSVGASLWSANFYLRVKAETERDLAALEYDSLDIFRPSFLLGRREEARAGEAAGIAMARMIGPLLAGPLEKYRAIEAATVARAMVEAAVRADGRPRSSAPAIHHYREMVALATLPPVQQPV